LLRQTLEFGGPLPQLILTGGDPLARPDLYELIEAARSLGIGVSITPAATPALTREVLEPLTPRPRRAADGLHCEYHALCGGSRARAYEAIGDPLGEDPFCLYVAHECDA